MELAQILLPQRIRIPLRAASKTELIGELVQLLADTGGIADPRGALEAVLKRESERSTGIGYGLAIPHGKVEGCQQLVMAAGKPATPVDFQSVDGRPVSFVVLLISPPTQTSLHIQALAKISRLMNSEEFRSAVAGARSAQELHAAIAKAESANRG
jgi:mannitol/fructose-specific phosphotransferase system IIA component (Ntr-type)